MDRMISHTCACARAHTHTQAHKHTCTCTRTCTHAHTSTHMHTHTHMHRCTCTRKRTRTDAHAHAHAHTNFLLRFTYCILKSRIKLKRLYVLTVFTSIIISNYAMSFSTNSSNLYSRDVDKVCFVLQDFDEGIGSIFNCINCQIHMVASLSLEQFIFLYLLMFFANCKIIFLFLLCFLKNEMSRISF